MRKTLAVICVFILVSFALTACKLDLPLKPYSIKGTVTDMNNQGISGVRIILSGDVNTEVITDSEGQYSATNLQGTVTVTPIKESYTFTPESQTVHQDMSNVSFIGTSTIDPGENIIRNMFQAYMNKNSSDIFSYYSDHYFETIKIPRDELTPLFQDFLDTTDIIEISIHSINTEYIDDQALCYVIYTTDTLFKDTTRDISTSYQIFHLAYENAGWLIQEVSNFSPEEELLRTKLNEFLSALQNKDLDTLASLIDDNYIDETTAEDKEVILDKYQYLMSQIEIHNYNISSEDYYRFKNQNNCSSDIVFDITVNGVRSTTEEYLSMTFDEANSDWLITSLYFSLFNILE